jgi:hypothetical protein
MQRVRERWQAVGWGARRGASGRQYRAITGDVGRLKLLVEPLPATSSCWLGLHGMQSSTPDPSVGPGSLCKAMQQVRLVVGPGANTGHVANGDGKSRAIRQHSVRMALGTARQSLTLFRRGLFPLSLWCSR